MQSWVKGAIGFIGFFGIIAGYIIQAPHLSGYLDLAGLIKTGLLAGAVVGGILGYILHSKGRDQDARFSIYAGMLVLGVATGPLVLSILNRAFSGTPTSTEYNLISIDPVIQTNIGIIEGQSHQPDAHIVTMAKEDVIYTIRLGSELDNYLIDDDSIILNIRKGGLKYDFIDHRPTDEAL